MEGVATKEEPVLNNDGPQFEAERIEDTAQLGFFQKEPDKPKPSEEERLGFSLGPLAKAAVVYSILPKETAVVVAQNMNPTTLNEILKAWQNRPKEGWNEELIQAVIDEFLLIIGRVLQSFEQERVPEAPKVEEPKEEPLEEPKEEPLEEPKEEIEPPTQPEKREWFSFLEHVDKEWLLELLVGENPQVIAVVLSYVNREQAAYLLSRLPLDQKAEVVERMVKIGNVTPSVLSSLEGILKERLREFVYGVVRGERAGSIDQVAQILNQLGEAEVQTIIENIKTKNPEIAGMLESKLLTFEDLKFMDNRDLQRLLRSVDMNQLALALKGASEEMRQKVFANLSARSQEVLRDELDALGPTRLSQIEKAQRSVVEAAKELSRLPENPITLPRVGGGDVIVQ